jgi:hypothetical protein
MGLERRFWVALALYALLGILIWFTLGEDVIHVAGREVKLKWIPALILAGFAFRTVLYRKAEQLRRGEDSTKG